MEKNIFDNYEALSVFAAEFIAKEIHQKREFVLGLPTGSTPIGMYHALCELHQLGKLDFSNVKVFNLDEYIGIDRSHPQSYYSFMTEHLYSRVNLKPENIHIPSAEAGDLAVECALYDKKIAWAGGIDLMVLGVGANGHIGFNEPADKLMSPTHVVELTRRTIEDNARFFEDVSCVPVKALTMGVGSILKAKKILMLISGKAKQQVARELLSGYITTKNPATLLMLHPDVTVMMDKDAACED